MDQEFDFVKFLESLKGLTFPEIELKARQKHQEMYPLSEMHSRKGSRRKNREGVEIRVLANETRNRMSEMLFWMGTGIKPGGMSVQNFLRLEPVCKELVQRKELKPLALDVFAKVRKENPWPS